MSGLQLKAAMLSQGCEGVEQRDRVRAAGNGRQNYASWTERGAFERGGNWLEHRPDCAAGQSSSEQFVTRVGRAASASAIGQLTHQIAFVVGEVGGCENAQFVE